MGHALKKIAELHTTEKNYNNLKDFIDDYKNISNTIKSYTDEYNKIHKQLIYKKQ